MGRSRCKDGSHVRKQVSGGNSTYCYTCARASHKRNYSPEKTKDYNRRANYGITREQFETLLSKQGGVCAICLRSEPNGGRAAFSVDHDHNTGKVRGLLCLTCNSALGYLYDSTQVAMSAYLYLKKHKELP